DSPLGPISFTIDDVETPADSLLLTASSSNPVLVPVTNIVFSGTGTDRAVTILPATNQFGSATITIAVHDGNGATASDTFVLTVNSVNDLPTISIIGDQVTNEDTPISALPFTIG